MCTSQNSHSSLVKTHRSQCIQSSCFVAVLTLLFLSKLPFSLQLLHTHTPPKVTCTWLQHLDSHPENHLGPWLQTQRKERAGPTLLRSRQWEMHIGTLSHMQSNAVGNIHPDHCGHSHQWKHWEMRRQTCGHTHAHLQTITCARGHAHRHPNPPTFRHQHRCLARPQHQAPPPPFRRRWEGLGFEGAPPSPSLWPHLSKVQSPRGLGPAPPPQPGSGSEWLEGDGKPGLKLF